ncbi:MAG: DUF2726 domain-containing protein [Pseudomonadales bacterium]|nr:DUF2726 domain-containing protein [Pseudomonadales bacterium]
MFPYHMRDNFLSPAELNFYNVLKAAVDGNATICTKVNLNDIFYVKQGDTSRFRIYTNKIDRKHVDFVLCNPVSMRPLVALELDDRSHQRKDRQERDAFVDSVFEAANLPLVHIQARRSYQHDKLKSHLEPYLKIEPTNNAPMAKAPLPEETTSPTCPKCGSMMILRTAKKGTNAGNQFWGCSNYPQCRTMLPASN